MPDTTRRCARCAGPSAAGCPCLAAYAPDQDAYFAALDNAMSPKPTTSLRVVTAGPPRPGCTQGLTCPCESCVGDRQGRTAQGAGPSELRVRPMSDRHRKAA